MPIIITRIAACGLLALAAVATGCGDNVPVDTSKDLTAWSLTTTSNPSLPATVTATITGEGVFATVPVGTDLTRLVASFEDNGVDVDVDVGGTPQVSDETANNFTTPVVYRLTAADDTVKQYAVSLMVMVDDRADLSAFSFTAADNPSLNADVTATIAGTTITAEVPSGTDPRSLIATFTTDGEDVAVDQTEQVSGTTINNFRDEVDYLVYAVDGTQQTYAVTVTVAPPI
ncbi:MAG TPA: hypothetical protein VGM90_14380 [Kofleriaceae bacterium]